MILSTKRIIILWITVLFVVICGCDTQEEKAYKHLKKAREYSDETREASRRSLEEYEKAYNISSKEFWVSDYIAMSWLYGNVKGDEEKSKEFYKKANDMREIEKETGDREWGLLLLPKQ